MKLTYAMCALESVIDNLCLEIRTLKLTILFLIEKHVLFHAVPLMLYKMTNILMLKTCIVFYHL